MLSCRTTVTTSVGSTAFIGQVRVTGCPVATGLGIRGGATASNTDPACLPTTTTTCNN
jgi:hypothetical protein